MKQPEKSKEVKKVIIKPKNPQAENDGGEAFAEVSGRKFESRQSGREERGGRGRRGNDRGGRGRGGEDRGGDGGEGRGRGSRRGDREGGRGRGRGEHGGPGRGRGGGRGRERNQGLEEGEGATVDTAEAGGFRERYAGKAREEYHPMDRKSGTGRGKRDQAKGGAGKGNWGDEKAEVEAGQEEEEKRVTVREEPKEEPKEESEEEGLDLDTYLATVKNANITAKGRAHEKITDKKREENKEEKVRVTGLASNIAGRDVYKVSGGEGVELLGFGAARDDEDDFEGGRGRGRGGRGRGGRGRGGDDRGPRRQKSGGSGRGRGSKVFTDNDFPAL